MPVFKIQLCAISQSSVLTMPPTHVIIFHQYASTSCAWVITENINLYQSPKQSLRNSPRTAINCNKYDLLPLYPLPIPSFASLVGVTAWKSFLYIVSPFLNTVLAHLARMSWDLFKSNKQLIPMDKPETIIKSLSKEHVKEGLNHILFGTNY